jgi:hypothetical protein
MELGLMPDNWTDYVELLDASEAREVKREKFRFISDSKSLLACDYCSGEQGTSNISKRFQAAEQIGGNNE